jgi:hypothetical protein
MNVDNVDGTWGLERPGVFAVCCTSVESKLSFSGNAVGIRDGIVEHARSYADYSMHLLNL